MESTFQVGRFNCTVSAPVPEAQNSSVPRTQSCPSNSNYRRMCNIKLIILYGSETGTAEEISERAAREAVCFGLKPKLSSMDSYLEEWKTLVETGAESIVCFVCSTTGQGEVPKNMQLFWKSLLRKSLARNYLTNIRFAVFGLGDSSYAKYNFVGKKLHKRLGQLGGRQLLDLYLGDDQHELGPDAILNTWLNAFWHKVFPDAIVDANGIVILPDIGLQPKFFLCNYGNGIIEELPRPDDPGIEIAQLALATKERVTDSDHFQDVHLFTFDMGDSNFQYSPGDVLNILPKNLDENVELFYELFPHLKERAEDAYYTVPNGTRPWAQLPFIFWKVYPQPWTIDFIVKHYFDLQAKPRRQVFELMEAFTTSEIEREKLKEFCTPEGQQDLNSYCYRPRRTVLEVIQDFPHSVDYITEDYLFDMFTPIKPRSFSIASSMKQGENQVQILVAIIEYKTQLKKPRLGLCSNFLKRLSIGENVIAWVQNGSFTFPTSDETPLILVGPGTGCAPFRSLIAEKHGCFNELVLFFGCRNNSKDFFFKTEWLTLKDKGELKLYVAFSRDTPDGKKVYVQNLIEEEGDQLWELINKRNGMIFVAGNAKEMPSGVREAFTNVVKTYGAIENAADYIDQLVKENRYQTEVWS